MPDSLSKHISMLASWLSDKSLDIDVSNIILYDMNTRTTISTSIADAWWSIADFFVQLRIHSPWIIVLYIFTIIILLVWDYYTRQTYIKANTLFRVLMDHMYYTVSQVLYHHREEIYDFHNTIPILLQHKTDMIAQKAQWLYYNDFDLLIKEVQYIYQLTNTGLNDINIDQLTEQYAIVKHLKNTTLWLKGILNTMTLWIYHLMTK